jgi:hypothetical protein
MLEEVLESEAVEELDVEAGATQEGATRPLPEPAPPSGAIAIWRDEVKAAALVAGAGIVAGAATVAAVRAVRRPSGRRSGRRLLFRREPQERVVASRSFLVDIHMLGSK